MRKKILLIWQYGRKDWVEVFEHLSNEFDFVFCAEVFPESSTDNALQFATVVYWSKYINAQEMLDNVKPHKIVFMGIESLHTAALVYAAKKKKIETLYLQHGLYSSLDFYLRQQEKTDEINPNRNLAKNKNHGLFMLKFYLATFKLDLNAFNYLRKYIFYKNKITQTQFLVNHKFKYRIADKYVVFTKENAKYLSQRDGFSEERYIEIGNPSFDKYLSSNLSNGEYLLLIDTPLVEIIAEGKVVKKEFSMQEANEFYTTINKYAKDNGLKLFIKLHPYSYNSKFYIDDDNITYYRDTDIVNLIAGATKIISFFSTLTLAAILKKDFLIIRTDSEQKLLNDLEDYGMKTFVLLKDFKIENIVFENLSNVEIIHKQLLKNYLYKVDGNSTSRFRNILNN